MPLTMADMGACYTVRRINGRSDIHRHLEGLGVVAGSTVTVVSKNAGGIILNVKESRVAIGYGLVNKVLV